MLDPSSASLKGAVTTKQLLHQSAKDKERGTVPPAHGSTEFGDNPGTTTLISTFIGS